MITEAQRQTINKIRREIEAEIRARPPQIEFTQEPSQESIDKANRQLAFVLIGAGALVFMPLILRAIFYLI